MVITYVFGDYIGGFYGYSRVEPARCGTPVP